MQTSKTRKDGQAGQADAPAQTGKRTTKLYNVSEIGIRFDAIRSSDMRPLDATVHAMRDRIAACLAEGYSITDIVEMLQQSGIDGTDRQLRYALDRAGIHRRQTRRGRTAAVRRQAAQAGVDSAAAERGAGDVESVQDAAGDTVDGVQDGDDSGSAETQILSSSDMDDVQNGNDSDEAEPQDAPGSDGDAAQADAMEQQARRPAWTPRPGALHAFGNVDTSKLDKYRELNERRGRK